MKYLIQSNASHIYNNNLNQYQSQEDKIISFYFNLLNQLTFFNLQQDSIPQSTQVFNFMYNN